jgi:hypothetical protein
MPERILIMRPRKLGAWEPTPATFEREGTVSVGGGPPTPARFSGRYVENRRLRVFDLNLPRLFWLTVFWRGWADGGEPALTISLWKPSNRRRWLHVWRWETDPDASGMVVAVQAANPPPGEGTAAPPYCDYCGWMRQADIRGECPRCGQLNL